VTANIDWAEFDRYPENTCRCRCGTEFRSHSKLANVGGRFVLVTRRPCPACGRDDSLNASRSDPESFSVGGNDRSLTMNPVRIDIPAARLAEPADAAVRLVIDTLRGAGFDPYVAARVPMARALVIE
jgi:hypothetical protein